MHLVPLGLCPAKSLRSGSEITAGGREASVHSPGNTTAQAPAPSPLWLLCVTKASSKQRTGPSALQGSCSCFANEIAWLVSKIRDLLKMLPRKRGGGFQPSPTASSRICLIENELKQFLGKILQKSQRDPSAVSRKVWDLPSFSEKPLFLFQPSHPYSPLGPARTEPHSLGSSAFPRCLLWALLSHTAGRKVQGTSLQPWGADWWRPCRHLGRHSLGDFLLFLIRKQFLQNKKVPVGRWGCCGKDLCFVGGELKQSALIKLPPKFFISVEFKFKMNFPKKASVPSCIWGLAAELHLLRTTWMLPKPYGSWAELPGSTAQRREWDPNPRKCTAYFNVKQTYNKTFHVSSTNWNKTFLPQKRQNASLWSKKMSKQSM